MAVGETTTGRGWIVGVVGANGVGKSTLLRMLLGQESPDSGQLTTGATVSAVCVA